MYFVVCACSIGGKGSWLHEARHCNARASASSSTSGRPSDMHVCIYIPCILHTIYLFGYMHVTSASLSWVVSRLSRVSFLHRLLPFFHRWPPGLKPPGPETSEALISAVDEVMMRCGFCLAHACLEQSQGTNSTPCDTCTHAHMSNSSDDDEQRGGGIGVEATYITKHVPTYHYHHPLDTCTRPGRNEAEKKRKRRVLFMLQTGGEGKKQAKRRRPRRRRNRRGGGDRRIHLHFGFVRPVKGT